MRAKLSSKLNLKNRDVYTVVPGVVQIKGDAMLLNWAIIFLILALVAGVLGFGGIARESAGIAKILFFVFIIIYVISFFLNRM
jgi:uncharacterized membrane protein YtjA (UPF0391 family)